MFEGSCQDRWWRQVVDETVSLAPLGSTIYNVVPNVPFSRGQLCSESKSLTDVLNTQECMSRKMQIKSKP